MKRIAIMGCPGSGKSTLARALGDELGLPVHHLDALFWQPGWVEAETERFAEQVQSIASGDEWIIDGGYVRLDHNELRFKRADIVVLLDRSRWLCMARVIHRVIKYRNRIRPDMGEACPEKLEWELMSLIWSYRKTRWPELLERARRNKTPKIILDRNPKVEKLIEAIEKISNAAPEREAIRP